MRSGQILVLCQIPALAFFHMKRTHRRRSWDGFPCPVRITQYHQHACAYSYLAGTNTHLSQVEGKEGFHRVDRKGKISSIFGDDKSRNKSRRWVKTDPCIGPQGQFTRVTLGVSGDWGRLLSSKGKARSAAGISALFCSLPPLPPSSSSMLATS